MIIESYPGLFGDLHRSENIFEQSPFSLPLSEAFEVGGCYQHSARTVPNRPRKLGGYYFFGTCFPAKSLTACRAC